MEIKNPSARLKKFWGKVDHKHIEIIAQFVKGKKVLDLGAGYGTTASYLGNKGFDVTAIDLDDASIAVAKTLDPGINYLKINAEALPFADSSFDSLILRDALHHFVGEADFDQVWAEMNRVLKPGGTVIFFDPNVNLLLKTMRSISRHDDEECALEEALQIIEKANYVLHHKSFNTLFSLPLSGGYVGINFVPQIDFIQNFILGCERLFERMVQNQLGRQLAWRYVVVGIKPA
ncbi:MAG TPA: methyltransferase domain-containing protein [Bacteroidetes bacterium]|nr:methyltransferase domain-containing protein [Bacteroidota bacterium]